MSMAKELGPKGVHVAHVVIDGAIDTEFIRSNFPERYKLKSEDGILGPDHIAQHYVMLQRNLLYTGVTRGKRLVVLVGQQKAVAIAVRNVSGRRRWSKLDEWLAERRQR